MFFFLACIFSIRALGQSAQTLNYQGIARDASGTPLKSKSISIRLSIHAAAANGVVLYSETKSVMTNDFGLYSIGINDGSGSVSGSFSGIDWAAGPHFLQTEIDPENTGMFADLGTGQMHPVPTAITAQNLSGVVNPQEGDRLEYRGGKWIKRSKKQYYNAWGAGSNPSAQWNFLGHAMTVTITDYQSQVVKLHISKAVGSMADGGAAGLTIALGFRAIQADGTEGPVQFLTTTSQDHSNGAVISNIAVVKGTRFPIALNGAYKMPANGTYKVGMIANAGPSASNWNYNEGGISYVEVD